MFTGIVKGFETILKVTRLKGAMRLLIATQWLDLEIGESIAVDGMCVTVTGYGDGFFTCDLSMETLSKTIAERYVVGRQVNLERALVIGDRLGGHFVTGHVDGRFTVTTIDKNAGFWICCFSGFSADDRALLVSKGSVTINGVSLTINSVSDDTVAVTLIPQTLESSNLSLLREGDLVNVEFDTLAKMVATQLAHQLRFQEA